MLMSSIYLSLVRVENTFLIFASAIDSRSQIWRARKLNIDFNVKETFQFIWRCFSTAKLFSFVMEE